jgi:hypothetical protein
MPIPPKTARRPGAVLGETERGERRGGGGPVSADKAETKTVPRRRLAHRCVSPRRASLQGKGRQNCPLLVLKAFLPSRARQRKGEIARVGRRCTSRLQRSEGRKRCASRLFRHVSGTTTSTTTTTNSRCPGSWSCTCGATSLGPGRPREAPAPLSIQHAGGG